MRRILRLAALTAAAVLVLGAAAAPAWAAPGTSWSSVEVRLINQQGGTPSVLVGGELDPSTKLPAPVSLSVPPGTKVDWAGEVLGGDLSKDPTVQYTTTPKGTYDELAFNLSQARRGQVEYSAPSAIVDEGGKKKATLTWVAPVDVKSLTLAVLVPSGATVSDAGGAAKENASGADFYVKRLAGVKAGQQVKLSVAYAGGTLPGPAAQGKPQPGGTQATPAATAGPSPVGLLLLVLAAILGVTFFMLKRAGTPPQTDDESDARPVPRAKPATAPDDDDDFDAFGDADGTPVADTRKGVKAGGETAGRTKAKPEGGRPAAKTTARKAPAKASSAAKAGGSGTEDEAPGKKAAAKKSTPRTKAKDAGDAGGEPRKPQRRKSA